LLQIYQSNSSKILEEYDFYKNHIHEHHYQDSPFGASFYAELEMARKFRSPEDHFEFKATIELQDEVLFQTCHELEVSPTLNKFEWSSPTEDPDEIFSTQTERGTTALDQEPLLPMVITISTATRAFKSRSALPPTSQSFTV
jgi:hypothetical protein